MNTNFEIIDNKVVVHTDNKGTVTREVTNNIEEILICENNIEELKYGVIRNLEKITFSENKISFNIGTVLAGILWFAGFAFSISQNLWIFAIIQLLGSICITGYGLNRIKLITKDIKARKSIIKELENNLQNEKEKLNELNKNKSNNLITQNRKKIFPNEEIYNLKKKLEIIYYYEINKVKLIKYYKKGSLADFLAKQSYFSHLNNSDLTLLEELIKNDLNNDNIKENNNQKILEKK